MRRTPPARAAAVTARWPIATMSVLAVTAVPTVLQFPFPQVRTALWRDSHALAAGQWWRLVTPCCGVVGQAFGYLWEPPDAGASWPAPGCSGRCAPGWCRRPGRAGPGPRLGVAGLLAGMVLVAVGDMHGPPLLVGFGLGALLLWWDRRHGHEPVAASPQEGRTS